MDVPRLQWFISEVRNIRRHYMTYLTSPFFRWFMSMWMPSVQGELELPSAQNNAERTFSQHAGSHSDGFLVYVK